LFENKYVSRAALGYLQLEKKLSRRKEDILNSYDSEYNTYMESDEYSNWFEKQQKIKDDDDYKNDPDPKGYKLFMDYLEGKWSVEPFVTKVCRRNWQDADLHAKAVPFYIKNGKLETILIYF
jgi:hypothetical protein